MDKPITEKLQEIEFEEEIVLHLCEYNDKRWSYIAGTKLTDDYVFASPYRLKLSSRHGVLIYSLHELSTGTLSHIESKCRDFLSML